MGNYKQSKPRYPKYTDTDEVYQAQNKFVKDDRDNTISREQIKDQLAGAPPPREPGLSGYPHKFENKSKDTDDVQIEQLKITKRSSPPGSAASGVSDASSTTSLFEYPVHGDSHHFDWNNKRQRSMGSGPEHLRAITNQNSRFKGVLAHEGTAKDGCSSGALEWVPVGQPVQQQKPKK